MKSVMSPGLETFIETLLWWFQDFHKASISNMLTTSFLNRLERSIPSIAFASRQWLTSTTLEQDSPILQGAKSTAINQSSATIITILPLSTCRNSWRHVWMMWKDSKQVDFFHSSTLLMLKEKRILLWWTSVMITFKVGLDGYIPSKKNICQGSGNLSITYTPSSMIKTIR